MSKWVERVLWVAALGVLLKLAWPARSGMEVGSEAPTMTLRRVNAAGSMQLGGPRDKPLLIEVFASWCGACRSANPSLSPLTRAAEQGRLDVVAVSVDDFAEAAANAARTWPIRVPVLHDRTGQFARGYQVRVLPTFILVDRQGRISDVSSGVPGAGDFRRWLSAGR